MKPDNVILVVDDDDARPVAVRVPRPNPEPMRMTGPGRGEYEAASRVFANPPSAAWVVMGRRAGGRR